MARLFITRREIELINDWTKEFLHDTSQQKLFYYPIDVSKSTVDPVYGEVTRKVFGNPVEIHAQVGQPEWETKNTSFGPENTAKVEAFVQVRDLLDKKITLSEGDYFEYGDIIYEIVSYIQMNNIFGQDEYDVSYKITGKLARPGEVDLPLMAPFKDRGGPGETNPVQKYFVQSRGFKENSEGPTGDVRQVRERLGEDMEDIALGEGPRVVSDTANPEDDKGKTSSLNHESETSFYDE